MHEDDKRSSLFTRRSFILAGLQGVLLSSLAARLYYLQVLEHDRYLMLSEKNRMRVRLIFPERGAILDRHGGILAKDEPSHRACIIRQETESLKDVLRDYCTYMNLSQEEFEGLYKQIRSYPAHLPFILNNHLAWEQVIHFETQHDLFKGVYIDQGCKRFYPYGEATAHLLGYLSHNNSSDGNAKGTSGKSGVEKICDPYLQGVPGQLHIEVDVRNRKIRTVKEEKPQHGNSLALTISGPLQKYAYERLQETQSGAVLVMDVQKGDLLTCVSIPSYNPNHMASPYHKTFWEDLLRNPMNPLLNKVIQGQYSPGSLFKPIVALAGLAAGAVTPEQRFFCSGCLDFNKHLFHCHLKRGHGHVSMEDAIRLSCDVYFYELARLVGIQKISQMAHMFGLGHKTALNLPGEQKGLVPDQEWKWRLRQEHWRPAETLMTGIGQGYLLATPLQMMVMLARLANGVARVEPRLLKDQTTAPFPDLELSPEWIQVVQKAMYQTSNLPGSTAYASRINHPGYEIAGKTATVQVKRISLKDRKMGLTSESSHAWHEREHAMFMAYAPAHNPRYGVYVLCEHGGRGSRVAAPIGRDILLYAQEQDILGLGTGITPSLVQHSRGKECAPYTKDPI